MDKKHTRKRKKSVPPPMITQAEMSVEVPKLNKKIVSYFDLDPWEQAIYFNFFGGC